MTGFIAINKTTKKEKRFPDLIALLKFMKTHYVWWSSYYRTRDGFVKIVRMFPELY